MIAILIAESWGMVDGSGDPVWGRTDVHPDSPSEMIWGDLVKPVEYRDGTRKNFYTDDFKVPEELQFSLEVIQLMKHPQLGRDGAGGDLTPGYNRPLATQLLDAAWHHRTLTLIVYRSGAATGMVYEGHIKNADALFLASDYPYPVTHVSLRDPEGAIERVIEFTIAIERVGNCTDVDGAAEEDIGWFS